MKVALISGLKVTALFRVSLIKFFPDLSELQKQAFPLKREWIV